MVSLSCCCCCLRAGLHSASWVLVLRAHDTEYEVYGRLPRIEYLQRTVKLDVRHGCEVWEGCCICVALHETGPLELG
jgi:hypothetical protein